METTYHTHTYTKKKFLNTCFGKKKKRSSEHRLKYEKEWCVEKSVSMYINLKMVHLWETRVKREFHNISFTFYKVYNNNNYY